MSNSKMYLFGGEKDGDVVPISAEDRPDVFFAVPNLDMDKITKTKGTEAKRETRDRLAILAYQFDPQASGPNRFVMRRNAALDKVRSS